MQFVLANLNVYGLVAFQGREKEKKKRKNYAGSESHSPH
jgi:hypothetical protein